jgi:hypothetical protein
MRQRGLKVLVAACVVFGVSLATAAPSYATALSGSVAASPPSVPAGGSTLLTVTVTPSDSPPSTNILVSVNGSATNLLTELPSGSLGQASTGSCFNFENLDPTDPQTKFDQLAGEIVTNLKSPDLIAGEEVQDSSGPADTGVVDSDQTLAQLVAAIQAAGGPTYDWRYIAPVDDQDDLMDTLPLNERYSYEFEGNAQVSTTSSSVARCSRARSWSIPYT